MQRRTTMRRLYTVAILATLTLSQLIGCAGWNRTIAGGAIGAGVGGAIGGVIGKKTGNTAAGALIGAVIGGSAGAAIGRYMDKQAEEIKRDIKDARVERVGEGIKITFNSGILFDIGSDKLKPQANQNISELARILGKYEDTDIIVEGHTDSTGAENMNQKLSEDRAGSVSRQLSSQGVSHRRVITQGFGETKPVADNGSGFGRAANRRVEVAIFANDKLKKAARSNKQI
jgi:outer membrane protein OmpA-like peptidoglycan-associated protein